MEGNRRLKKLFRSSKSGAQELIPSDSAVSPASTNSTPTSPSQSIPTTAPINSSTAPIHDMHKRRQPPSQGITPFPVEAGRPDSISGGPAAGMHPPLRRPGESMIPSRSGSEVMEDAAASAGYRRQDADRFPSPRSTTPGTGSMIPAPDSGWPGANAPAPAPPQPAFYLPPGAAPGPPGPPSPQVRPSTPPLRMIPSAGALPPPQAAFVEGESFPNARGRGYSSASQTGRPSFEGHAPTAKLAKPVAPVGTNRSPLVNSYDPQAPPQQDSWSNTPMGSERSTPREESERAGTPTDRADKNDKEKKRFWNWGNPKHKEKERERPKDVGRDREAQIQAQRQMRERETQQQRGMGPPPARPALPMNAQNAQLVPPPPPLAAQMARASMEEVRASTDERRVSPSNNGHTSSVGHGDDARVRAAETPAPEGNDVGSAIRKLAGSRETTHGAVLDVCERVNASQSAEAVGKEAARTIRKILKGGTDAERRMALRIWWITMRNIQVRGYHHHATNRKFMATIEPIMNQTLKPPASMSTLKACRDILSDLTFNFSAEKGCEGLYEVWKRVKAPNDPEFGKELPEDYLKHGTANAANANANANAGIPTPHVPGTVQPPISNPPSRRPTEQPSSLQSRLPSGAPPVRSGSPRAGPGYANLPDHQEDVRRLIEECTAGKESARVLTEALVYTRPDELEHKGVIKEFYTKCVRVHESLTSQMNWASSEAERSRRVADSVQPSAKNAEGFIATIEESALGLLFESHGALSEALKQYDDLEKMAMDEREIRAVQERSKKDTRMDRRQQMDMLMAGDEAQASSSRSPSPAMRSTPLPEDEKMETLEGQSGAKGGASSAAAGASGRASPMQNDGLKYDNQHLAGGVDDRGLSRTPSPDSGRRPLSSQHGHGQLPAPPKGKVASPTRTDSPLGRTRVPGPRPLPNPFRSANSNQNLAREASAAEQIQQQYRSGGDSSAEGDLDGESRPSNKALGKRRADPDNDFDPDGLFKVQPKSDAASERSITADDLYLARPVVYAYDAWAESQASRKEKERLEADQPVDERSENRNSGNPLSPISNDDSAAAPHSAARGDRQAPVQNVEGYSLDAVAAR